MNPEDDINNCFAIDDGGKKVRLSDMLLCPYSQKICKKERCIGFKDNHCTIFEKGTNDTNDGKTIKKPDLVEVLQADKINNIVPSQVITSPPIILSVRRKE